MKSTSLFRPALLAAATAAAVLAAPAWAQADRTVMPEPVPPGPPAGHMPGPAHMRMPTLTLDAAARSEVPQDTVRVTLAHEVEAADAAAVSSQLNQVLKATLDEAKGTAGVTSRNGNYQVWPNTDQNGKITAWRGRAEVVLESRDFDATSALTGKLGNRMAVAGIDFSLSEEARQAEEAWLLTQAANAFQERAKRAAQAFGFNGYSVGSLNLSGSGVVPSPRPMMMARSSMAKAEMAPVSLEGGRAEVTVSVRGTINLLAQ